MLGPIDPIVSRRTGLKGAAVGGAALLAGDSLLADMGGDMMNTMSDPTVSSGDWFAERLWSMSGNKVLGSGAVATTSLARTIHKPGSAEEIAGIVRALPAGTPIACVCGGHESSNAALFASRDAVVLDMARLKSIEFQQDGDGTSVTVGSGVVFRELVEAVKEKNGALPVGTGPGVGVVGYLVNGGLSGYFSRRLGLLGQRVLKMTIVTTAGEIRVLTPTDELFDAMLGAGSALAIVVDVTIRVAEASTVRGGEQRVIAFETRAQAVEFTRGALRFMRENAFANESVSMELVVTGTKVLVATVVFYDAFAGETAAFVGPLEALAAKLGLQVVANAHWDSWYQTAAALWPVINAQKGFPLATMQHCVGTKQVPDQRILDFIAGTLVAEAPLDEAEMSLVEIRTLGGAALTGRPLPSGNCHHAFFVDLITLYDAKGKSDAQRQAIADLTKRVVDKARAVDGLVVDFSGTHSQPDDPDRAASAPVIFGTAAMAEKVKALKAKLDPANQLRFHPFAKFV